MEGGLLCVISKNQIFFIVRIFFTTVSLYIFIYLFDLLALKKKKTIITFITLVVIFFFVFVTSTITDIRLATIPIITLSLWQYVPQPL